MLSILNKYNCVIRGRADREDSEYDSYDEDIGEVYDLSKYKVIFKVITTAENAIELTKLEFVCSKSPWTVTVIEKVQPVLMGIYKKPDYDTKMAQPRTGGRCHH